MGSFFDTLSRGALQPAISGLVADDLTAIPQSSGSEYKESSDDGEREAKQFRGKISLIEKTEKLDGTRRGGELSGFINLSVMDAELWMEAAEYEALGYDLLTDDHIQNGIAESGDTVYKIVEPKIGPHGEFFCGLVREA